MVEDALTKHVREEREKAGIRATEGVDARFSPETNPREQRHTCGEWRPFEFDFCLNF